MGVFYTTRDASLYASLRSGRIGECMLVLPPTSYMGGADRVTVVVRWRRTVAADQDITKGERILEAIQSSSLLSEWKRWHEAGISFENLSISKGISELSGEAADVTQRQDDDNDATQEAHADELTCELLNVLQHGGEKVNADFGTRAKKGARLEQQERAVRFRGLYAVTAYMDHLRATLVHQALRRHQGRVSMPVIIASHSFDGATLSPVEVQVTSSSVLSSTSKETQDATALYTVRIAGPILLDNVLSLIEACSEHRRKPFKTTFDCDPKCHFGLNAFTRSRDRGRLTGIEFDPADGWCLRFEPIIETESRSWPSVKDAVKRLVRMDQNTKATLGQVRRLDCKGVPTELGEKSSEIIGLCVNYRGGPRISEDAPRKWNKPRSSCDLVRREVLTLFIHFELPYRMIVVVEATGMSSQCPPFREAVHHFVEVVSGRGVPHILCDMVAATNTPSARCELCFSGALKGDRGDSSSHACKWGKPLGEDQWSLTIPDAVHSASAVGRDLNHSVAVKVDGHEAGMPLSVCPIRESEQQLCIASLAIPLAPRWEFQPTANRSRPEVFKQPSPYYRYMKPSFITTILFIIGVAVGAPYGDTAANSTIKSDDHVFLEILDGHRYPINNDTTVNDTREAETGQVGSEASRVSSRLDDQAHPLCEGMKPLFLFVSRFIIGRFMMVLSIIGVITSAPEPIAIHGGRFSYVLQQFMAGNGHQLLRGSLASDMVGYEEQLGTHDSYNCTECLICTFDILFPPCWPVLAICGGVFCDCCEPS
ncbi:hypothetical protein FOZ60_001519 [Perkinsus olseni]|uniref:Uncharacterized protein n=1 Tax=Perkinsus olseni TaxID=32597 RepID=A0A7J6P2L7_PEROL|nr:hypothetical protein FOZ60_001519 [Perkinsus olseni]